MIEIAGNRWWQRSEVNGGKDRQPLTMAKTEGNWQ